MNNAVALWPTLLSMSQHAVKKEPADGGSTASAIKDFLETMEALGLTPRSVEGGGGGGGGRSMSYISIRSRVSLERQSG